MRPLWGTPGEPGHQCVRVLNAGPWDAEFIQTNLSFTPHRRIETSIRPRRYVQCDFALRTPSVADDLVTDRAELDRLFLRDHGASPQLLRLVYTLTPERDAVRLGIEATVESRRRLGWLMRKAWERRTRRAVDDLIALLRERSQVQ